MPTLIKISIMICCTGLFVLLQYAILFGKGKESGEPPIAQSAPNSIQPIYAPNSGSNAQQTIAPQSGTGNTQIFSAGPSIVNGPGSIVYIQSEKDLLPGTNVTEKQLREKFPFGYVVFAKRRAEWMYRANVDGPKWDLISVLTKTEINPDFSKGMVQWTLPELSIVDSKITGSGILYEQTYQIHEGYTMALRGILIKNVPVPYVGVISADQLAPVYIVGFRIPPEDITILQPFKI